MLEKIFDIIKNNLKNPRLYIVSLIIIVVILLLFPYIDANFFYYTRVEKRINILKDISSIDKENVDCKGIEKQIMSHADKAIEYFNKNFNCAQGIFTTYAVENGFDEKLALKLGTNLAEMPEKEKCVVRLFWMNYPKNTRN